MTGLERACRKYGEITHHQEGKIYLLRWDDTQEKMIREEIKLIHNGNYRVQSNRKGPF